MSNDTIFGKIIRSEIPADKVYEDEDVLAFRDVNPAAPTHILVIPKRHLGNLAAAKPNDEALLGKLLLTAARVAREAGIEDSGYRIVANVNRHGGESVPHLHIHVLGGRQLSWPPG